MSAMRTQLGKFMLASLALALGSGFDMAVAGVRIKNVGDHADLRLSGNPSTGYTWRVNAAASENLEILTIEDLGYVSRAPAAGSEPIVGAPEDQAFRVTAKDAGHAKIVLEYARPWESDPPVKRQEFVIDVGDR